MARAIALSLSPEVNLRDQNASDDAPSTPKSESKPDGAAAEQKEYNVVKTRPSKFSAEELLELGPFTLPSDSMDLHNSIAPHSQWAEDPSWDAQWRLFTSCSMLSLFRVLEVNFFHVEVMGIAPASVGLGQISKLNPQQNDGKSEGGNPLLESLKSLVLNYVAVESPPQVGADKDTIGTIIFSSPESCSPVDVQNAQPTILLGFKERHMILASKLAECLKLARSGEQNVEWKFHQLDLLCARLALPDMAQQFVPTCVDVIEHDTKTEREQTNGENQSKWSPVVIRASLDSGSLSARCLYDYISGHGPPGLLDTIMESPAGGPSDDALNADTLANAYDEMWDMGRKQKAEALEWWQSFSFKDSYELVHAPLLPLLEKEDSSRPLTLNARIVLFRSLQDLMIQRLGGSRGDEPPALEFDSSRDASVATYVGGDRQGWGLIGTRALWHARSKVRGDYGDGFTTGSVVRVRLNTDSGALSFGVGDSDWGIAFDGLTQHGTLYPAIGLYQRDDQVTILPVQPTVDTTFAASSSGEAIEHKGVAIPAVLKPFLHHAGALLESCCSFLSSPALNDLNISDQQLTLTSRQKVERARDYERLVSSHPLLFSMVTPLISSLSLIRNYHGLSSALAMTFVPWCIRTMQCIERVNQALRALASSEGDETLLLQYHLTLSQGKDGSMHGRSSGSFTTVTLNGIARGTKVSFVETWRQGGTCLVEGRLRADGTVFTGSYEDTKSHTSGCIVGNKISRDTKDTDERQWVSNQLVILEMVIANLLGYFGHALTSLENDDVLVDNVATSVLSMNEAVKRDEGESDDGDMSKLSSSECSLDDYDEWVSSSLLEGGLPLDNFVLPKTLSAPLPSADSTPVAGARLNSPFLKDLIENRGEAAMLDQWVSKHVGESPFVRLGGEPMKATRRTVCAAMIWHSGFLNFIKKHIDNSQSNFTESDVRPHDNLMHIWRAAQRVIEWAIRAKNSMGSSYTVVAGLVIRKAQFLLEIEPSAKALAAAEAVFALTTVDSGAQRVASKSAVYECAERIYSDVLVQVARFVEAPIRVSTLQSRMLGNCTAAFLRTIGMLSFRNFVGDSGNNHRGVLTAERHEVIHQWWSWCVSGQGLWRLRASLVPAPSASTQASTTESSYYLNGLGGCGKHLKNDLRDSFESLYGYLTWGIIIQPDDHSFLSRVGIFRVLQTVLDEAQLPGRDAAESRDMVVDAPSTAFVTDPTQSGDPSTSGLEAGFGDGMDDAQEYCYQICSLLYSVSGSPVCRSHLSSSRWLRLLLALVDVNSPQIQRRILKLLRRLLPSLDPSSIKVRYDEVESFDMDSDDEYDADGQDEPDHASTLINFFVGIVGMNNPPSVAKVIMGRLADSSSAEVSGHVANSGFNDGGLAAEVVLLLRSLYESEKWAEYLNRAISDALASIPLLCVTEQEGAVAETADSDVEMEDMSKETPSLESWATQTTNYVRALSALCILDGQIEGIHVGGTVKIMPRSGSSLQEIAFRGARGVVVAYETEKSAAEVLLRGNRADETNSQQQSVLPTRSIPTRPVRVPIDDLFAVPEVELPNNAFSDEVLQSLLVARFPYFLAEVKKSLMDVDIVDALNEADEEGGNDGESEDDDDMSNDGSSSPSAMDSEMPSGAGVDESDSEANGSPRHQKRGAESASPTEPTNVLAEMEKESRLHRMLLCQHGLRASATLLKNDYCAATFIRGVGPSGLKDLLTVAISETPTTAGVGDISSLEESWLMLWSRWYAIRSAHAAPSPLADANEGKNKARDAAETTNSPGPMVQQMMEMGFPKEWCDVALARCSQNVEAAINFCFEHSSDMERLVSEYRSSRTGGDGSSKSSRKDDFETISPLLEQLSEMGFPFNWCKKALAANRNNVDAALTWILSNGEALEAEDRRDEEAKLRASGGDGADGNAPTTTIPEGEESVLMPNPLRAVSGQACIGEHDLMVEGLVGGGFASVGAPDCLVSSGRWYYEAILHTNGCIQIGWADVAFCGAADRGDGVGDGAHSWAYDGWRQQRWHGRSSPWGSKWKQGDVIGCGIDADAGTIIFSLNGKMRSANMGVAFRAVDFARGVYPCASFNRRERLQFNLGGTPFKYSPPPGFQPILNVLSDTHDLSSVPKGFDVIGSREDCLEESMGDENYSSDTRYFARDLHPSMLRSSGHSRSSGFASGSGMTKADALAEIKALPDNRVYVELLVVTRSLAILQARRALLTLLAKWPTSEVGPFSVAASLSGGALLHESEDSARFIDFIKLIASLSALHVSNALPSTSLTLPDGDALHLLDCGATGRFALGLLSGVVKRASERQYSRIPWNSSEAAITATLLQITAEAGQTWSDKEVLNHPNLFLAEWISGLLLESLEKHKGRLSSPVHDQIRQQLLQAWMSSLKSPSMCVKERGATILAGILQDILPKTCGITDASDIGAIDGETKMRLKVALGVLPLQRLVDLSQERILREYSNVPVCSNTSVQLQACKRIEVDLEPIDQKEYEEVMAAKKLLEAKQAQLAAEEALKQEKLAAERVAAAEAGLERDSSSSLGEANTTTINSDTTNQDAQDDVSAARNSGVTNMEVDNSDSEEAPDITLSAIANMEIDVLEAAKRGIMGEEPRGWKHGNDATSKARGDQPNELKVGCKVIRGPNWKWRDQDGGEGSVGVVEGVSPWSGVDGEGMSTLRLVKVAGVMEWPDYGAAVRVVGMRYADGSLCVQELQLSRGNPDMGWMLRFGTEKWQPGTKYMLRPFEAQDSADGASTDDASNVDSLRGEFSHAGLKDGELVEIRGELQLSTKYLFTMDHHNHFSTLGISSDGMSVTCHSGESRNLALGTVGFTTGVHYWEVHVEQAEFGSVFIGVCEKAGPPGSQAALSSRLNRWHGWGFVNFRATYHNSTERIYGDHFNASDTIGVRLDMEQGKLSFFMDGIKFGEHIVSDLGVAFENIKGERNSRTLYPCIGMRKGGDRVTLNQKWVSMPGVSPRQILSDAVDVSKSLHSWYVSIQKGKAAASAGSSATDGTEVMMPSTPPTVDTRVKLPETLLRESWSEWKRWSDNHWQRCHVRPRGISVDFDTSPAACIRVSNAAGLGAPFLAGDRVRMCSKCGQELNQPEEAVILGVYRGFLWYRTETQGNEGADEGRAWAWYWSPSELPELLLIRRGGKDMTLIENSAMDMSDYENAPDHSPFKPRSALEERAKTDFDAFVELATRAHSTTSDMQLVERLNAYCAAIGLDVTNLKITDVVAPAEMEENASNTNEVRGRSRTRSLVKDDYFTSPALKNITGPELRARTAVLRSLNSKILRVLPIIAIQPDDGSNSQPIEVADSTGASTKSSTEFLSTSMKLRSLRRLVFTSTKRAFWDDVLRSTTTSTPLPSDEYEDPREIRVIRINRIQAQASKLSLLSQPGDRLRRSVFGQLYREMRAWSDSFFRRAYCGKGHGGQRRAFKVKFLGEGVNDYGGPYRAVFEQIVDELQMDNVELAKGEQGLLPLLIPCPNRRSATGINQDKFLLNPSCGTALLANGPMALDLHRFLGKLIGTAVRHGLQMGLDLPSLVWRPLAGLEVSRAHLESVDVAAANNLTRVEELSTDTETAAQEAEEVLGYLTLSTTLSDGVEVPLVPQGEKMPVTLANRELYVQLVKKTRLTESSQQLAALKDGLASVLPMELAPLFTPRELEVLICGRREVDVDLLHQCTEYSEGADEAMPHVQHFWEVLREMTSEERTSFLRFVWARSRMPNSAKDFPMNFKLQTAQDPGASSQPDLYLPHAQTCFFALRLPAYSSKEVLRTKLLYAIQNSPNMDADVRLHNAEGWADA
ncbi:Ubiquitin-associated domain [Phytophthora cactorum]|nr:Ubiquitin-associated domain [Phytophthora cactorum]